MGWHKFRQVVRLCVGFISSAKGLMQALARETMSGDESSGSNKTNITNNIFINKFDYILIYLENIFTYIFNYIYIFNNLFNNIK